MNAQKTRMLSGGAIGADTKWGEMCQKHGIPYRHLSFPGHNTRVHRTSLVTLSFNELDKADEALQRANRTLKRHLNLPPARASHAYVANLLRRNWYQVRVSDSVFAVSSFDDKGQVKGGTAWAVQMYLDRWSKVESRAFVFDQERGALFQWKGDGWQELKKVNWPHLRNETWAGIGTRELNPTGEEFIKKIMERR